MKRRTLVKSIAGVLIAAAGVALFLRQVNVREVAAEVGSIAPWKIIAVALLNPATLLLRSLRWRLLLPQRRNIVPNHLFPLVTIGFMINNLLPARIGEAVRVALLCKRNRYTVAESIGSLLVERFLDVCVYALFLVVPLLVLPQLSTLRSYGYLFAAGIGAVVIALSLYALFPMAARRIGKKCFRLVPRKAAPVVLPIVHELVSNLDWLFSAKRVAAIIPLSLITLLCQVAMLQILGFGTGNFTIFVSMYGIAFAAIGAAIPLAPGYVGTLHAMMLQGMGMAGIGMEVAGAIAVLYHAIGYVSITLLGSYYFFRLKLSVHDIQRATTPTEQRCS